MAKHEPWYKPRDEDQDERLLAGFLKPQPPAKSGGGCARIAAPVVAAVIALLLAVLL